MAPGFIEIDIYRDIITRTPLVEVNRQTLLGRVAYPLEVAEAVLFLASDTAS